MTVVHTFIVTGNDDEAEGTVECSDPNECKGWVECRGDHSDLPPMSEADASGGHYVSHGLEHWVEQGLYWAIEQTGCPVIACYDGDWPDSVPAREGRYEVEAEWVDWNYPILLAVPSLTMIAAVARNGVIGSRGELPWSIPADLEHFKSVTMGHPIIMGRTTFESIGVLPGRLSIVLTRDPHAASRDGVTFVHSLKDALELSRGQQAYVIGGAQIYRLMMPYADRLLISEIPCEVDGDVTFPAIDGQVWQEVSREDRVDFSLVSYRRCPAST